MLADFQQALADLTGSPALCVAVRTDEAALTGYDLTGRERARLLGIVRHPGMASACTVYRMNRIAPLAMNLRATMHALGPALRELVGDYWRAHPRGHAHFYIESARFAAWLAARVDDAEVAALLARERAAIDAAIAASLTEI